jgi:hypothetical protein
MASERADYIGSPSVGKPTYCEARARATRCMISEDVKTRLERPLKVVQGAIPGIYSLHSDPPDIPGRVPFIEKSKESP